jgi:hypothetical protein
VLRFALITCTVFSVAACASSPKSVSIRMQAKNNITTAALGTETSIEEIAAQNDQAPCPRFIHNLDAAETIINATPRNYPHML